MAFTGDCDVWALRCLKRGFRHCFALIRNANGWVVFDPMLHKTDLEFTEFDYDVDVPRALRLQGFTVVRVPSLRPVKRIFTPLPFTCVEAIKRLIGLQDFKVLTPYQLYRRLHGLSRF